MSSVASPPPERPKRRAGALTSGNVETRSIQVGIIATLLIHLLLALILPKLLDRELVGVDVEPKRDRQFEIEINPDVPEEKPKRPANFVETNPDAPENKPDKTENFGAHDQQLAQPKPAEKPADRPSTEGRDDVKSTQIVSGNHQKPVELVPAVPSAPAEEQVAPEITVPKLAQTPLPGHEKLQGESPDAVGTSEAKPAPDSKPVPEKVEGVPEVPVVVQAEGLVPVIDPKKPQQRRTIAEIRANSRPAVFESQAAGTSNIGVIAHNALKTTYGAYLQRLIDAVDQRWNDKLSESRIHPPPSTRVTVAFQLDQDGYISKIVKVEGTAGDFGEKACVYAISPRPDFSYGKWPDDMRAILGPYTELTFEFFYTY